MPPDSKSAKPTYKQQWTAYNAAQIHEKARFQILLHELCRGIDEPIQERGRPRMSLADMIFSAAFKVYSTISARRFSSDLKDAQAKGYVSHAPHFNIIFRYLQKKSLTPYLRQLITESSLPLKSIETDFAVDSSGFSTNRFARWFNAKYGQEVDTHDWVKVHLMCGVKTNIVTSVEVSGRHANDYPFFQPLLETTARSGFKLVEVSADKAYIGAHNLRLTLFHGAIPYIPFKSNSTADSAFNAKATVWNRLFHFYNYHHEEFLAHYHKRSNVETTFSMIKAKFGERVRSKMDSAQTNEVLCKVLCHNICVLIQSMYELNIDPVFWQGSLGADSTPAPETT
jgi:transposase